MLQDIPGGRVLLTLLAVGAFLLVLYYLRKTPIDNTRLHIALGLVGGGAIGNLVDRVIYGKVTDFIVWKVGAHEWPAFNIADAALCIGVGLMLLDMVIAWWGARKAGRGRPRRSNPVFPTLVTLRLGGREIALHSYGVLIAVGLAVGIALAYRQGRRAGPRRRARAGRRVLDDRRRPGRLAHRLRHRQRRRVRARLLPRRRRAALGRRLCCPTARASSQSGRAAWCSTAASRARRWSATGSRGARAGRSARSAICSRRRWRSATPSAGWAASPPAAASARPARGRWAVAFPRGSVAFDELAAMGAVPPGWQTTPALHPVQLYEAFGELIIFAALLVLRPRVRRQPGRPAAHLPRLLRPAPLRRRDLPRRRRPGPGLRARHAPPRRLAAPSPARADLPVGRPARQPHRARAVRDGVGARAAKERLLPPTTPTRARGRSPSGSAAGRPAARRRR